MRRNRFLSQFVCIWLSCDDPGTTSDSRSWSGLPFDKYGRQLFVSILKRGLDDVTFDDASTGVPA